MKAPGNRIKVNDTYMHAYRVPQVPLQKHGTIVFLSGSGTECPTYDFKPLWFLLIGQFNVAVVERPGYGWSGQTNFPRSIDIVLEETREALRKAGIVGPYIPAPHSLSGLEAIYWAQKYPDEVSAIIGLDMVVPQVYDSMEIPKFLPLLVRLGHVLRKPYAKIVVKSHVAVKSHLLNREEQEAMYHIISKQVLSRNMIDEIHYVKRNAQRVANGICPSIPVLCCLSKNKKSLKHIPLWGKAHHEYFTVNNKVKFLELSCGHYVHREAPGIISRQIAKLFSELG